jgi:hypothetical protein
MAKKGSLASGEEGSLASGEEGSLASSSAPPFRAAESSMARFARKSQRSCRLITDLSRHLQSNIADARCELISGLREAPDI